ncbi:MAG: hypothetical protein WCP65_06490, partial [Bacteroidota bacterium]
LAVMFITYTTVVNAGGPSGPGGDSGCTDASGNCDLPLDNNVIIVAVFGVILGVVMLRKKLNTASLQS